MKITVRIFGYLRMYGNRRSSEEFTIDVQPQATAQDLLKALAIPETEDVVVVINNNIAPVKSQVLREHDVVLVYPFLGGG